MTVNESHDSHSHPYTAELASANNLQTPQHMLNYIQDIN